MRCFPHLPVRVGAPRVRHAGRRPACRLLRRALSPAPTPLPPFPPLLQRREMYVIKRDGREEPVQLDKITARIAKLTNGLNMTFIDPVRQRRRPSPPARALARAPRSQRCRGRRPARPQPLPARGAALPLSTRPTRARRRGGAAWRAH